MIGGLDTLVQPTMIDLTHEPDRFSLQIDDRCAEKLFIRPHRLLVRQLLSSASDAQRDACCNLKLIWLNRAAATAGLQRSGQTKCSFALDGLAGDVQSKMDQSMYPCPDDIVKSLDLASLTHQLAVCAATEEMRAPTPSAN